MTQATAARLGVPFDVSFNATVRQIAHPAGYAFAQRPFLCEVPEPDALHAAADHESARHQHEEGELYRRFPVLSPQFAASPRNNSRPPGIPGHGIDSRIATIASPTKIST